MKLDEGCKIKRRVYLGKNGSEVKMGSIENIIVYNGKINTIFKLHQVKKKFIFVRNGTAVVTLTLNNNYDPDQAGIQII